MSTPVWTPFSCYANDTAAQNAPPRPAGGEEQASANIPERYELFTLGPGEKKVTWVPDSRVPNTAVFTFNKEDHTLGNLISQRLLKYKYIQFSAYRVPHPLFASIELRVTTDGTITPKESIHRCCVDIINELGILDREFTKEWELKKIAGQGQGAGQ